jgi:hypothetical protein
MTLPSGCSVETGAENRQQRHVGHAHGEVGWEGSSEISVRTSQGVRSRVRVKVCEVKVFLPASSGKHIGDSGSMTGVERTT